LGVRSRRYQIDAYGSSLLGTNTRRWGSGMTDESNSILRFALAASIILSGAAAAFYPPSSGGSKSSGGSISIGNVTYRYDDVQLPTNGSGWNGLSSFSFGGVSLQVWVENESVWSSYIQGTGEEPGGPTLTFAVVANDGTIGGVPVTSSNLMERSWFSPDGVFGVTWMGEYLGETQLRLYVAYPLVAYRSEQVQLTPLPAGSTGSAPPSRVQFQGVSFVIDVGYTLEGEWIVANATFPNGSMAQLELADGGAVMLSCGISGDTPAWLFANSTCEESASSDGSVAMTWDYGQNVTLMVRP
jgi:hypothetical protein